MVISLQIIPVAAAGFSWVRKLWFAFSPVELKGAKFSSYP